MGSEGRVGSGDGVNRVVHAGLFGSPRLVLVAVAALPFPWDGAGNAGMARAALLWSEYSCKLTARSSSALLECKVPQARCLFQGLGSGPSFPVPGGSICS